MCEAPTIRRSRKLIKVAIVIAWNQPVSYYHREGKKFSLRNPHPLSFHAVIYDQMVLILLLLRCHV